MKIKKTHKGIIGVLLIIAILVLSGCETSGNKTITYKQYTKQGISYEVPNEMVDDSTFSVAVKSNMSSDIHEYFFETYMYDFLKGCGVQAKSHKIEQHGSYKVYNYNATSVVDGESCPVNVAGIGFNDTIYIFTFIWQDYAEDRVSIYNRFLESLK